MDTQTTGTYSILLASLAFLTLLLVMFLFALFRQFVFRLKEYQYQLAREIAMIDSERKRMHIDLHDEFGSGLALIGILTQQLNTKMDDPVLEKINRQVLRLRAKIREIAFNFVPPILESHGLKAAVLDFIEEIRASHKVRICDEIIINDNGYKPAECIHVYRILRELLTNALKHANCSQINITMKEIDKTVYILVSDNGCGFDDSNPEYFYRGFGMSHIQSRSRMLKATLQVISHPNKGTVCSIKIPFTSLFK